MMKLVYVQMLTSHLPYSCINHDVHRKELCQMTGVENCVLKRAPRLSEEFALELLSELKLQGHPDRGA